MINGKASQWIEDDSGVPQRSILGPLLFIIVITGIKIFGTAGTRVSVNKSKADLQVLFNWSEKWQMKFNTESAKVCILG